MNLKCLRKSKKITQEEAARFLNIPLRSYKRLENNNSYINSTKYKDAINRLQSYKVRNKEKLNHNIIVFGAGYVGFSLAVLFATNNHVTVIDIDKKKVEKINSRTPLFKDDDIEYYLKNKKLNLKASLPNIELYKNAEYIIVAVPTNYDERTKMFDMSNVLDVIRSVRSVNKDCLIIIKSTCYVGFTKSLNDRNVIFSPEFLREGKALYDNLNPSRIIIGGSKNKKVNEFASVLTSYSNKPVSTLFMKSEEAEAVKLFSNAFLAMRVSYFNEIDSFAIKNDLNALNVINGISLDPRIGDYYNNPSFGFGGYCLPKDTEQIISQMNSVSNNELLSSINRSNKSRKELIVKDILKRLGNSKNVGVYSLNSKLGSDSVRSSSTIDIINGLKEKGINVVIYDGCDLDSFVNSVDLIITNRYSSSLDKVKEKVYTRDLFNRD